MRFTFVLQQRSDDLQIDEVLALSDDLGLLLDVVEAQIRLTLVSGPQLTDAYEQARQEFANAGPKTPSLRIEFRTTAGMTYIVSSAPYAERSGR